MTCKQCPCLQSQSIYTSKKDPFKKSLRVVTQEQWLILENIKHSLQIFDSNRPLTNIATNTQLIFFSRYCSVLFLTFCIGLSCNFLLFVLSYHIDLVWKRYLHFQLPTSTWDNCGLTFSICVFLRLSYIFNNFFSASVVTNGKKGGAMGL